MSQTFWQLKFAFLIAFCIFAINAAGSNSRPTRDNEPNTSEALKYLQALDTFYSNNARPRHSRSERSEAPDLETAIHLLQLDSIDRKYSSQNRPRFGKRNTFYKMVRDRALDDEDMVKDDWQSNFYLQK